jgi:putative tryptophan/tyrosine transport system substrate-binding protein
LTQPGHLTAWTCAEKVLRLGSSASGVLAVKRREFITLIGVSAAWPAVAQAQRQPTLGLLGSSELADWAIKSFRTGLEEGGYVEGRNLTVIYRSAENQFDRLPALAAELVKSQVSVIFATGSPVPARAAKAATSTIPIVFAYGGDPVSDGLVESFNRPGGNVTGATFIGTALTSKRMELLREILPQVSDVALLVNPKGTLANIQIKEAKAAAQDLGLALHVINSISESEFEEAFATMSRLKVGAFLVSTDPLFGFNGSGLYVTMALRYGIPAICVGRADVFAGGLFSYGATREAQAAPSPAFGLHHMITDVFGQLRRVRCRQEMPPAGNRMQ